MSLKWESFADENFKFKLNSWYGTSTFALEIHVARPCFLHAGIFYHALYNSMFVTVCYFHAAKIFSWICRDKGRGAWDSFPVKSSLIRPAKMFFPKNS
jgi:hypothetical protein